jgi:hypothetical protein
MSVEEDIITRLAAVAGGRVYPSVAPQGVTAPYVVYQITDGETVYAFGGPAPTTQRSVEIQAWATTYSAARVVLDAVTAAMTPHATDLVVAGITEGATAYSVEEQLFGVSAEYSVWAPGLGTVVYIMLTDSGGVALTAQDGTTALTVQQ